MRRRINLGERREVELKDKIGSVILTVVAIILAVVIAYLTNVDQMPEHWWRTVGPGSAEYEKCYAAMRNHAGKFHLERIEADRADGAWVFRWQITTVTDGGASLSTGSYTCVYRDGRARLREPTFH